MLWKRSLRIEAVQKFWRMISRQHIVDTVSNSERERERERERESDTDVLQGYVVPMYTIKTF